MVYVGQITHTAIFRDIKPIISLAGQELIPFSSPCLVTPGSVVPQRCTQQQWGSVASLHSPHLWLQGAPVCTDSCCSAGTFPAPTVALCISAGSRAEPMPKAHWAAAQPGLNPR